MADVNGRFVWYELMTTDRAGARAFYSQVVGWKPLENPMPGIEYEMFAAGDAPVAGMVDLPEDARKMGTPPSWIGYVAAADVDATTAKVKAAGGTAYVEPRDIPNMGRFAVLADPQGAAFALWKSANPDQDQPPSQQAPGRVGWHELYTTDYQAALDFYSGLFGWQKQESMDMGEMGVYQMFGVGDQMLGGMMNKPPNVPVACWQYYFNVGNIDEAGERVKAAGGQVVFGPQEVPGGGFIIMGVDPQGANFALFGNR
jgi:predicted enzyme related to lactoylglutathione lyase